MPTGRPDIEVPTPQFGRRSRPILLTTSATTPARQFTGSRVRLHLGANSRSSTAMAVRWPKSASNTAASATRRPARQRPNAIVRSPTALPPLAAVAAPAARHREPAALRRRTPAPTAWNEKRARLPAPPSPRLLSPAWNAPRSLQRLTPSASSQVASNRSIWNAMRANRRTKGRIPGFPTPNGSLVVGPSPP